MVERGSVEAATDFPARLLTGFFDAVVCIFFFFNDTATTEIYTLSLHDALPIWAGGGLSPAYAWQRCVRARCVPVGTGRTYRVRASDAGGRLLVSISAPGV